LVTSRESRSLSRPQVFRPDDFRPLQEKCSRSCVARGGHRGLRRAGREHPALARYRYVRKRCAKDLREALARGDRLHVATGEPGVLGLAWVLPHGGFGRTPYLKLLAVSEHARGAGIGARLLRAAEGDDTLMLLVSDFNRAARRFYAHQDTHRWERYAITSSPESRS